MNKKLFAEISVIILVVAGAAWALSAPKEEPANQAVKASETVQQTAASPSASAQSDQSQTEPSTFTLDEVAKHNSRTDCWTVINGSVYNLTSYISRHPGEDNILSACGIDATSYFNGERAGQEGGTNNHSNDRSALSDLARLKIGNLAN